MSEEAGWEEAEGGDDGEAGGGEAGGVLVAGGAEDAVPALGAGDFGIVEGVADEEDGALEVEAAGGVFFGGAVVVSGAADEVEVGGEAELAELHFEDALLEGGEDALAEAGGAEGEEGFAGAFLEAEVGGEEVAHVEAFAEGFPVEGGGGDHAELAVEVGDGEAEACAVVFCGEGGDAVGAEDDVEGVEAGADVVEEGAVEVPDDGVGGVGHGGVPLGGQVREMRRPPGGGGRFSAAEVVRATPRRTPMAA